MAATPFDGESGRLHLVDVDYKDARQPASERLLWELEPVREVVAPTALPDVAAKPMPPADFDALLRAARWSALSPYLGPDGEPAPEAVASPFHGAVQVESYQLQPLLQALRMPRVNLLIADDVGLGKTIEAGLILAELLLRRRIRRVLVLTPASLRTQWRDELLGKFALRFEVVDRKATDRLRRQMGMDANPWRSFNRIVASYHYLRQPDVREQFLAACRVPADSPHLPWDLLIVDECHNLMPSPVGQDSELCQMLRAVAPQFEHRLFLSATPHNGHTRSFTGLLEMLDPVRFSRTGEMTPTMRERLPHVLVRRLKRHIDACTTTRRFCRRHPPEAIALDESPLETALADAFDAFRLGLRSLMRQQAKPVRRAGAFAVEILGKRLLSCPTAFAESWRRARQGLREEDAASASALGTAERAWRQELGDDRETEQRAATAATVAGAWLKNHVEAMQSEIGRIETALDSLGFDLEGPAAAEQTPRADARFDALTALIDQLLVREGGWQEERLIVFTEYKTTLDYLARRLRERHPAERILTLFGTGGAEGMDEAAREEVKAAFNNPSSPVRLLIATDAAAEGLNLHRTARYLLHYDCPWNPSRLEQRNGRIDRYGQGRDVTVHHFVSDSLPDLRFLDHIVRKAHEIREDLGSLNEIFGHAVYRRLIHGENAVAVQAALEASLKAASADGSLASATAATPREVPAPTTFAKALDLDAEAQRDTLEAALATAGERPQLVPAEDAGFYRLRQPGLPGWRDVVDDALRTPAFEKSADGLGPVPRLAFEAASFTRRVGRLEVFLPPADAALMHLAHPLMRRAVSVLSRRRYPGESQLSRWTVRRGGLPAGVEAAVLLSFEELAVNELRETFHHTVRTVPLPLRGDALGEPLPDGYTPSKVSSLPQAADVQRASHLLDDVQGAMRAWLRRHQDWLTQRLRDQLRTDGEAAKQREDERYRQRGGEISALIERSTAARLAEELAELAERRRQGQLFDEDERIAEIERSIEAREAELRRRELHWEELRGQLERERQRTLEHLLPKRFALAGEAQVFPVVVEVRLR